MRVNVARVWEDADYEKVRQLCEHNDTWQEVSSSLLKLFSSRFLQVYNKKDIAVFTQNIENSSYQMIKATALFPDVSASVAYDVLHDSGEDYCRSEVTVVLIEAYRSKWDKYMIKQETIGLINPNNDVCYYSRGSAGFSTRDPTDSSELAFADSSPWLRDAKKLAGDWQGPTDMLAFGVPWGLSAGEGMHSGYGTAVRVPDKR